MIVIVNARFFNPTSICNDKFQGGKQEHLIKTEQHRIEQLLRQKRTFLEIAAA